MIGLVDHGILYGNGILKLKIPGIVVLYSTIWLFGMWYCLIKYRFMGINPATISNDILSNIEDLVILLDPGLNILTLNKRALELLKPANNGIGKHISHFLPDFKKIENGIIKLTHENSSSLSCRLHFVSSGNEKILMDSKIKQLNDKYEDLLGYLVIANEVKEIKKMRTSFNITDREANVVQSIIAGKTNHEIAHELKISERTVKSHITHIFNKLNIDNRIQLMMLLKDFNLLPEHSADKILFIKNDYK
ncbi:MAG: helix-turn-helix transcriptional regulator [Bacteroidales bacterium]